MQTKNLGYVLVIVIIVTLLVTVCFIKSVKHHSPHKNKVTSNQEVTKDSTPTFPASVSTFVSEVNLTLTYPGQFTLEASKRLYSQAAVASFDFKQQFIKGKNEFFPGSISFLTSDSIEKYQNGCSSEAGLVEKPCLPEGYSGESAKSLQRSWTNKTGYKDYSYKNLGGVGYLIKNTKCTGDTCYNRQYTTLMDGVRIDTVITIFDDSFQAKADELITEILVK